jgi:hypothetical protein
VRGYGQEDQISILTGVQNVQNSCESVQPPIQGIMVALSLRIKLPEHESPSTTATIKNVWGTACMSLLCLNMVWYLAERKLYIYIILYNLG